MRFTEFLAEAKAPAAKPASKTSGLGSDDKGKLHELLLSKYLHPKSALPDHHRALSDNPDHAGTPEQVHNKLLAKVGKEAYAEIDAHAKQTAAIVKKHLEKQGHLGGDKGHKIMAVHWTSNRDTGKKAGDHEKTTGIKDVNSNADLILTTQGKDGRKVFHGVSAKYGSEAEPNYRNDGVDSIEKKANMKTGHLSKIWKDHESEMETIGYTGTKAERHELWKQHNEKLVAEKKAHKDSKAKTEFKPKSKEAKLAYAAELSGQLARAKMAREHEKAMSKMKDADLREHIRNQVSAPTYHNHIVAHSHVQKDGSAKSIVSDAHHIADEHLNQYEKIKVRKGTGISTDYVGTDTKTGKERVIASQIFKGSSGPHKGVAGAFKLR
jgi:hypothetical protein